MVQYPTLVENVKHDCYNSFQLFFNIFMWRRLGRVSYGSLVFCFPVVKDESDMCEETWVMSWNNEYWGIISTSHKLTPVSGFLFIFWACGKCHQCDDTRPRCVARERKTVLNLYWLKTPPAPLIAPGAKSTVSRLIGSRGADRQLKIWCLVSFFWDKQKL